MKNFIILFMVVATILLLSGCATVSPDTLDVTPYGFWGGLVHGFLAPIELLAMVFSPNGDYVVFHPNNNGAWYSFGFLIGCGCITFSVS